MNWVLQCPEGQTLGLAPGAELIAGAGAHCALRLSGTGVPAQLAVLSQDGDDAWLRVLAEEPPVGVNGRPVQSLARLFAGDRICFGAFCVDLSGPEPEQAIDARAVSAAFALRMRGGPGSGSLQYGPTLHLDTGGEVVSAAAGVVGLILVDGVIHLDPGNAQVRVNGHAIASEQRVEPGDQIQVGARRYLVEAVATPLPESVTERLPALSDQQAATARGNGNPSGLWWLILLAAVIAAAVAALLYFPRGG